MSSIVDYDSNFRFNLGENGSGLQFYRTGDYIYAIWMEKSDNGIYMSISINSGQKFSLPQRVMSTNGDIRDLQILAKEDQFVIALIEKFTNFETKRAVSGWLNVAGRTFSFKPCTSHQADGELINIFLSFNGNDSIDHMIIRKNDGNVHEITMGHNCSVKDLKTIKITTVPL